MDRGDPAVATEDESRVAFFWMAARIDNSFRQGVHQDAQKVMTTIFP